MPFYRLTGFFEFVGSPACGFSESWEFNRTSNDDAQQQALPWATERRKILSQDWKLANLRVARLAVSGDPSNCRLLQESVAILGCQTTQLGLLGRSDTPWTAILVDMPTGQSSPSVGSTPRPRRWQLRGIPDTWWDSATLSVFPAGAAAIMTYTGYVINTLKAGNAKGNAGCQAIGLQPYVSACIRRISSRRIGRPFGLLVGRRTSPAAEAP